MVSKNQKIIEIVKQLAKQKIKSSEDFLNLVKELVKKYQIPLPGKVEIFNTYKSLRLKKKIQYHPFFEKLLKKRPVRSLSGVAVISVLTKPYPCPGKCLYCPKEKGFPKSYLAGEPAAERAKRLKFDPYRQVKERIKSLKKQGHPTDKIELIIIGASWTAYPENYKKWFIKRCFDGANDIGSERKIRRKVSKTLKEAQKINEKASNRIVSISIETRPDLISPKEIFMMRKLGITKVELGVQIADDKILEKNRRNHGLKEVIEATRLLKDAGFKICYHIMPGLYGSNPQKDLSAFKKLFTDSHFRPDYLKIYPCVVTYGSPLYKLWQKGKYKPYSDKTLIKLLIKMKKIVPPYVRIIRIFRDIPSPKILGGTKISNLRELVQKEMKKKGIKCHCIRCREIKGQKLEKKNLKLVKREYEASGGKEFFLSFEDKKNEKLLAFLRLRLPSLKIKDLRLKILENAAIIRELHTYGELVEIGKKKKRAIQHKNLGRKLVKEAERIVKSDPDLGIKRIVVIAGVGSRPYWRKLGYRLQKTYMVKNI
ncbi:MAG: tRNA uridine(34) 5-carboxymethylaminomethyl modification radical SAM/GNAT enzyme Elp3 [Patescibacteria group bacterium]